MNGTGGNDKAMPVVLTDVENGIGCITLNRPERRNALHPDMYPVIIGTLEDWQEDESVNCVVLTGAGKGFCAGGDVRGGRARNADGSVPSIEETTSMLLAQASSIESIHEYPKPTIAAVNGAAVGAGMALALACDLRVFSRQARFIPGWIPLAFTGDFGGVWFLTRLVGPSRAFEVVATNREIGAAEALALGLANQVIDEDNFEVGWRQFAEPYASGPTGALGGLKENVRDAQLLMLADYLPRETQRQVRSGRTEEHKAAVQAWLEGRTPKSAADR